MVVVGLLPLLLKLLEGMGTSVRSLSRRNLVTTTSRCFGGVSPAIQSAAPLMAAWDTRRDAFRFSSSELPGSRWPATDRVSSWNSA